MSDEPLIPDDWRQRRMMPPRSARFTVEGERGDWQVIDWAYATTIGGFERKEDAEDAKRFSKEYVKSHGDIDFTTFPYDLSEPLFYDRPEEIERFWEREYPPRG